MHSVCALTTRPKPNRAAIRAARRTQQTMGQRAAAAAVAVADPLGGCRRATVLLFSFSLAVSDTRPEAAANCWGRANPQPQTRAE